jgi:hypothetical protein
MMEDKSISSIILYPKKNYIFGAVFEDNYIIVIDRS